MNINNLVMYCLCHNENFPRHSQFQQKKLMCNAHKLEDFERSYLKQKQFLFDDDGDNISNLNWTFGDLTGTYYVWKNTNHEFVGHNQYRRFWNETTIFELEENTLYHSSAWEFGNLSCAGQYIQCHQQDALNALSALETIAKKRFNKEHVHTLYQINHINACNMFFGHKLVYDKFCEVLFEIMFDVYHEAEHFIRKIVGYNQRMIAFLAERVMTSLIHNHKYFFGNTKMVPVPIYGI